jgi:Fe-S-cluster containining protein
MTEQFDKTTIKKIFKATPIDTLPKDCKGCGACCGPCVEKPLTHKAAHNWLLTRKEPANLRGMDIILINKTWWLTSPPCKFLNRDNECMIETSKPKICKDFQRGCDVCRIMYYHNKIIKDGRNL